MQGDIVFVDYERSSWKYMSYERGFAKEDLDAFKICGAYLPNRDTIEPFLIGSEAFKGGGSAYGGKWKPNPDKPQDLVFKGQPNSIARHFISTKKGGFWVIAKYDANGNAVLIRHETGHAPGSGHTNPHDHVYCWDNPDAHPQKGETINYPDGAPEFKSYTGRKHVSVYNLNEVYRFHTISEFKASMRYGAEVVIEWQGQEYGIWSVNDVIRITRSSAPDERYAFLTSDAALEFMVGSDRLRDVITQVTTIERTI